MKSSNVTACLSVLSACFVISSPVIAEDNCSGYSVGVGPVRVFISDDHSSPYHLASGDCTTTGASTSTCTFKDKDGDQWTDAHEWSGSGIAGTWRTVSGTGKYAKAIGSSGWWKMAQSHTVNVWAVGGYCMLAAQQK